MPRSDGSRLELGYALHCWWWPPNGSRLSCGRLARRRKAVGRQSVARQGNNTPLPLKRSPPVSFKRLLGGKLQFQKWVPATMRVVAEQQKCSRQVCVWQCEDVLCQGDRNSCVLQVKFVGVNDQDHIARPRAPGRAQVLIGNDCLKAITDLLPGPGPR